MKHQNWRRILSAGMVALCAAASHVQGQSVDALLDKLVDKGILTVKEANDLRDETEKGFNAAYAVKSGMPDSVTALKFNGDFRGRYEGFYFDNKAPVDRQRYRYRLRFGATAVIKDNLELGLRLSSSDPASGGSFGGDPISGNTTFQDNASKKFIYLDLAYGKWQPINSADWQTTLTFGKMENPFLFSDMVFDADYTPEGAALQLTYNLDERHSLKLNGGGFMIDEIGGSSSDPFWVGAQLRWDAAWSKKFQSSAGIAGLMIANDKFLNATRSATLGPGGATNSPSTTWTVPNQNAGNLRSPVSGTSGAVGSLRNHFNPVVADAALTYSLDQFWHYNAPFPIRFGGDYVYNPAAQHQNVGYSVGVLLGKSGKKGLWDLSYRYKYLEGDAWFEEFVDSDFGAFYQSGSARTGGGSGYIAGTNVRGHILKASYSPYDALTLATTVFLTETIQESPSDSKSGTARLQVDASLKF